MARQYAVTDEVFVSDDLSITGGAGGSRDISTSSASLRSAPSPQGEGLRPPSAEYVCLWDDVGIVPYEKMAGKAEVSVGSL